MFQLTPIVCLAQTFDHLAAEPPAERPSRLMTPTRRCLRMPTHFEAKLDRTLCARGPGIDRIPSWHGDRDDPDRPIRLLSCRPLSFI